MLKEKFRAQNLDFIHRQEHCACKQGPNEPLVMFTEDIIKKCQHLTLSDPKMTNLFINGLNNEIKIRCHQRNVSNPDPEPKTKNECAQVVEIPCKESAFWVPVHPPRTYQFGA